MGRQRPSLAAGLAIGALLVFPAGPALAEEVAVVPYGADYRYQIYAQAEDVPADWASASFDDATLALGQAPFGNVADSCSTEPPPATNWPTPSHLLIRRTFELPLGASRVKIVFGVDNDAKVAINGTPLTTDWVRNEGCPDRARFTLSVPDEYVAPGTNLVAVLGRASTNSYLDLTVIADVPAENMPPDCSVAVASPSSLGTRGDFTPVEVSGVSDPDGVEPALAITGVTQDEPTSGLRRKDEAPDAILTATGVLVRGERDVHGDGRVYAISFMATDSDGASCTGTTNVEVRKQKTVPAVDSGQLYDSLS